MDFERTFTGAPWEAKIGYCRAIRAGDLIFVTGTVAVTETGEVFAPGEAMQQAARCLEIIDRALSDLGADRNSVVRTRLFVTDISRWAEYGEAHRAFFDGHAPAMTMVEVSALIDPEMLIEIEVDAVHPRG